MIPEPVGPLPAGSVRFCPARRGASALARKGTSVPYSDLKTKKTELIRKARDGSVFIAPYSATGITTLTGGSPANEVQTVTITGTPTGGTFALTFSGQTASGIAYNAIASAVQTALVGLSNLDVGDVTVTGGPGPGTPYVVTFGGTYADTDVPQMTAASSLTGGTTPAVAVTTTTPGTAVDLADLPAGWIDLGWITSDGVTYGRTTDVSDVTSFGSVQPTRSDVTNDTITMAVVAQETSFLTLGLYTGADTTALHADATSGEFSIAKPDIPGFRYYRVLGLFVDRDDAGREIYMARYMPRARITEWGEQQLNDGDDPITYNMTFTGYEDSTVGYSHRWIFAGAGWQSLLSAMSIPTS